MEYTSEEYHKKGLRGPCPNLRKKSKGFFKGYDYSCSGNKDKLNYEYVVNVCQYDYYYNKGNTHVIKYDECDIFKNKGIVN